MKSYLNLSIGAKKRLAILKTLNPIDWKKARRTTFLNHVDYCGELSRGFNDKTPVLTSFVSISFGRELLAQEAGKLPHSGWFCNEHGGLVKGLVVRLPHGKFLHGYHVAETGETVYFFDVFTDILDAALSADYEARKIAELLREDAQKYDELQNLKLIVEVSEMRLRECLALRNMPCFKRLRAEALSLVKSIKSDRLRIVNDFPDF